MKLWSCKDGQFTQPHFFLGSCCGISRGRGGEYSDILVLYVGADHFGGVQSFKFQYLLEFSRKEHESFYGGRGNEETEIPIFFLEGGGGVGWVNSRYWVQVYA